MKDNEFCYWLKGAIDMNQSDSFGIHATETIKTNLNAVFAANTNPNAFCHFLQGYLTLTKPETIGKEIVVAIVPRLNNFVKNQVHEINKEPQLPNNSQHQRNDIRATC